MNMSVAVDMSMSTPAARNLSGFRIDHVNQPCFRFREHGQRQPGHRDRQGEQRSKSASADLSDRNAFHDSPPLGTA